MNRTDILETAMQAVTVDRAATHGDAERNFGLIAAYWSNHLGVPVSALDVAVMMTLLKLARIKSSPEHADHWTDVAGYAACGGEIATNAAPFLAPDSYERTKESRPAVTKAKPLRSPARTLQRSKFKPGPKWAPEEDEKAIDLTARGFTIAEVAERLGRPEHGTRKRLRKFSAEIKARAESNLAAREAPEPPRNGFTPEMDARLSRYMADGLGIGGASSMLKIHRDKVQARWDAMQVKEAAE